MNPISDETQLKILRARQVGSAMLVDFGIVIVAFLVALGFLTISNSDYSEYTAQAIVPLVLGVIHIVVLNAFGIYKRIWQRTSGHGITLIINAVIFTTIVMVAAVLLLKLRGILPLQLLILGNVFSLGGFVVVRYRSRLAYGLRWRWNAIVRHRFPPSPTRVLIIGAGESGQVLAWRLKHRFTQNRYSVIGFIDDDRAKLGMYVEGCPIIGSRQDIERLAETHNIDLIVVAIHNISGPSFREILTVCEKTKALIKVVPDIQEMVSAHHSTEVLRDVQAEDLIGRTQINRHEGIDLSPVTSKVILITGAAGSIGSELSRQVMHYSPIKVILLDNNESGLHDLVVELQAKFPEITMVPALVDVTIRSALRAVFDQHQPKIVFHAAAYKHVPMLEFYPAEALRVNVTGTRNVAELAQEYAAERFVLISTDKAVKPSSVMGASKRLCELMLHALSQNGEKSTRFAAVRFGNVLGSRGSVVPTFNRQIDSGGPVTVTHQDMTRYFMSIPEAVNLIIHAACMTSGDDIYVLQMGEVVRIVELAERMIRIRGLRPYRDIDIKFTGIRPGEKMNEELFNEIEKPAETQHPNILQVNSWHEDFNVDVFWKDISILVQQSFPNGNAALSEMNNIITPPKPPVVNAPPKQNRVEEKNRLEIPHVGSTPMS